MRAPGTVGAMEAGQRPRPKVVQRLEAQRERHEQRPRVVRWAIAAVGAVIFLAGVVMLITPGPAFVLIPVGLAVMSLEFEWAGRLLERALVEAERAQRRAAETTTTQRVLTVLAGILAVAVVLYVWARIGDVPIVPWF